MASYNSDEQKEQWKRESRQLKRDLDARARLVRRREVPIRLNTDSSHDVPPTHDPSKGSHDAVSLSAHYRSLLNMDAN